MATERTAQNVTEAIDELLPALEKLGFSLEEQAKVFGFMQPIGQNRDSLKRQLRDLGGHEFLVARCDSLYQINDQLTKIFDGDVEKIKRWIRVRQPEFMLESVYSLLVSGKPENIILVFDILARARTA